MIILQCPKCKNNMKYNSKDIYLSKKRKRCVYCGFSISISKHIVKKI